MVGYEKRDPIIWIRVVWLLLPCAWAFFLSTIEYFFSEYVDGHILLFSASATLILSATGFTKLSVLSSTPILTRVMVHTILAGLIIPGVMFFSYPIVPILPLLSHLSLIVFTLVSLGSIVCEHAGSFSRYILSRKFRFIMASFVFLWIFFVFFHPSCLMLNLMPNIILPHMLLSIVDFNFRFGPIIALPGIIFCYAISHFVQETNLFKFKSYKYAIVALANAVFFIWASTILSPRKDLNFLTGVHIQYKSYTYNGQAIADAKYVSNAQFIYHKKHSHYADHIEALYDYGYKGQRGVISDILDAGKDHFTIQSFHIYGSPTPKKFTLSIPGKSGDWYELVGTPIRDLYLPQPCNCIARYLLSALHDRDVHLRMKAAHALGQDKASVAVGHLIETLTNPEENVLVKRQAAWALGQIKGERARKALENAITEDEQLIRNTAIDAINSW